MCDPVLIAAILEELGCLDEKKEKDAKDEVDAEQRQQDNSKNSGEEGQKILHLFRPDPGHFIMTKGKGRRI